MQQLIRIALLSVAFSIAPVLAEPPEMPDLAQESPTVAQYIEAADAYAAGTSEAVEEIRGAIGGIRQLYPNHIWKEDEMVFPMAQRLFTQEEMKKLMTDFEQAETEYGKDHDQYIAFANEMEMLLGR